MRKFNEFIKQLSLTQQLFALIFFFVTFFAVFFFVYIDGNVNKVVTDQIYDTLYSTQNTIMSMYNIGNRVEIQEGKQSSIFPIETSSMTSYLISIEGNSAVLKKFTSGDDFDPNTNEGEQIKKDIFKVQNQSIGVPYKGIVKKVNGKDDSYYIITKMNDTQLFLTKTYSNNMDKFHSSLVQSVIYITVIVVGFFFIVLMMWVITLIHPLNQIRNYIERVKLGKDAELHVNRNDEIGELAYALISMREELARQERTKEEMIHNISHDLKTPIATIKSYGESIKDGIYPYDTLEKSVDVIIENADRLENKVHSLLFMNRVEYLISQDCEGISSNMQEVVEKVLQDIKVIKPEIEVVTQLEEVYFDGLAEPWRVCVENIIENALRYATSKIIIHLSEQEGLTIANDGPSMDEDRIRVLFKPFEKGQGGKFGLGLSIVYKVVNANHYEVFGENTANGVIFRINKPEGTTKKGR